MLRQERGTGRTIKNHHYLLSPWGVCPSHSDFCSQRRVRSISGFLILYIIDIQDRWLCVVVFSGHWTKSSISDLSPSRGQKHPWPRLTSNYPPTPFSTTKTMSRLCQMLLGRMRVFSVENHWTVFFWRKLGGPWDLSEYPRCIRTGLQTWKCRRPTTRYYSLLPNFHFMVWALETNALEMLCNLVQWKLRASKIAQWTG